VPVGTERVGQQGVVADLRVGVERQVVGGQRDVVEEQGAQALRQPRREPQRRELPEQPVVDEHELRALLDRPPDQLELGRDARHDALHGPRAGHLEAVRAHVVEGRRVQQLVEIADQVVQVGQVRLFVRLESCDIGQINAIVRRGCGIGQGV
jgi:hypothetical protein